MKPTSWEEVRERPSFLRAATKQVVTYSAWHQGRLLYPYPQVLSALRPLYGHK